MFICKILIPPGRDLGINKRDLGKVGWLACHMNTFCFSMRFLRIVRSRLAETARSSGTAPLHMNSPLKDYFEYIIKKHETIADDLPVEIYVNKIKNRIVFKIKTGYKLELLTEETMQLLGSSKKGIDKNKNGEIVPSLETVEVVLIHCNLVNNNYQQAAKVLFTFVPNKQFGQVKKCLFLLIIMNF